MTSLNLPIFRDLDPDDVDHTTTIVESCCMNCYKNVRNWQCKLLIKGFFCKAANN